MIIRSNGMQDTGPQPEAYSMAPNASVTLVHFEGSVVTVDA
jgi:hypothetical protein